MSLWKRIFGRARPAQDSDGPFMEHPTGEFRDAVEAMASAIARLRKLDSWSEWITFSGQGAGSSGDSVHFAELRVRGEELALPDGLEVDVDALRRTAGLDGAGAAVAIVAPGVLRVSDATPEQVAKLLDALYRGPLGVIPFEGETDYAVGAEW
jgi:hypothetical protein